MPDIKATITRPIGPLPAFAWVIVIVGGYFGYKFLSGRSGGGGSTTSTTAPTGGSGIPADNSALINSMTDLTNTLKGAATTQPITPARAETIQIDNNPATRFLEWANAKSGAESYTNDKGGFVNAFIPSFTSYSVKGVGWLDDPATEAYDLVKAYKVSEGGRDVWVLARNTTSDIITGGSNQLQDLSTPASMPQFDIPASTPRGTIGMAETIYNTPTMPTTSSGNVQASSLNIPAMTPA